MRARIWPFGIIRPEPHHSLTMCRRLQRQRLHPHDPVRPEVRKETWARLLPVTPLAFSPGGFRKSKVWFVQIFRIKRIHTPRPGAAQTRIDAEPEAGSNTIVVSPKSSMQQLTKI